MILSLIKEAVASGATRKRSCSQLGVSVRMIQLWRKIGVGKDRRNGPNTEPPNKISKGERKKIVKLITSPSYRDLTPWQIVPILADEGKYLASESTMYRILAEEKMDKKRGKSKDSTKRYRPEALTAWHPNEVYSWDITYMKSLVKSIFYCGYVVIDIFSRKIVGTAVHDCESSEFAAELIEEICAREGVEKDQLIIHSDNGAPMKGAALCATLDELGVGASLSRPRVSNDNAFSESAFKTLKYRPWYPEAFQSLEHAREWMAGFVDWYNNEHRHSAIKFVTPGQRHDGRDREILKKRNQLFKEQKAKYPKRWASRATRDWSFIENVTLNERLGVKENVS